MKRLVLIALLLLPQTGCAAWFDLLRTNPIAALQQGAGYIGTAAQLARTAFDAWAAMNPEAAVDARPRFQQVMGQVDRGLMVGQDALSIAAHASAPAPDANLLLKDAQSAMGNVHEFLSGLKMPPGGAMDSTMIEALKATEKASHPL